MRQTWRWFGPSDPVTLADIRQAGAEGVVTALYDVPPGTPWPVDQIATLKAKIDGGALTWDVVESLPVSEAIRTNATDADSHIQAWIASLERLADAGVQTVCYNFMPVLDWTRTDLTWTTPTGAHALRFDLVDFALFDRHILGRTKTQYTDAVLEAAAQRAVTLTDARARGLTDTILAGLPGAVESWTLDSFRARLDAYAGMDAETLRANLRRFLSAVVPAAEALGLRLCAHPDDPPWSLFGLPRILSTEADYAALIAMAPSPANGITFCSGSLGARPDVDLHGMVKRLGTHIHFAHLRNVTREDDTLPGTFHEAEHLTGSTDMVAVVSALLDEQRARQAAGRPDWQIPMRPDHGWHFADDRSRHTAPGYPLIGRLKGLAELRGVMHALAR
ncbi:MAG: mannonate dehydratase [Pseudomonadota bacterium]